LLQIAACCWPHHKIYSWGKKYLFSSKIEIIDGCAELDSGYGCSTQNSFLFCVSSFTLTNEQILDIMYGWTILLYARQ
jgi:hypothetical protein